MCPNFLEQLLIQEPLAALIIPPALAPLGFPRAEPSMFNLKKPMGSPANVIHGFRRVIYFRGEGVTEVSGGGNDFFEDGITVET